MTTKKVCKCGCGQEVRYAYAPGHRPNIDCVRCGKNFSPTDPTFTACSQCRRHLREGGPTEMNQELISSRKMQAAAPEGRRWCGGCRRYRLLKFFKKDAKRYYSRCKPCHKAQMRASMMVRKYNITPDEYLAIKELQGGKCAMCQVATGATRELAIDHDHSCCPAGGSCGRCVRGLLCSVCNKILGVARDEVAFFERAIEYLKSPPAGKAKPDERT